MLLALTMLALGGLAGDAAFEDGVRLYKELEYEQALARFAEISARPELPAPDKAEALVWLGLCLAGTGDLEASRSTFKSALVTDPLVGLPTSTPISPRVQTLFDEVRVEVRAAAEPPPPPPAPRPPPGAQRANTPLPLVPAGLAGLGVVALGGGTLLAFLAADSLRHAEDPDAFQSDAKAALDAANAQGVTAGVLLVAGAGLVGTGVALVVIGE